MALFCPAIIREVCVSVQCCLLNSEVSLSRELTEGAVSLLNCSVGARGRRKSGEKGREKVRIKRERRREKRVEERVGLGRERWR